MKLNYTDLTGLDAHAHFEAGEHWSLKPSDVAVISIARSLKRIADTLEKVTARPAPVSSSLTADDIFEMSRRK